MKELFQQHLSQVLLKVHKILENNKVDVLFIESGYPDYYFLDDQATAFRPNPHFLYFCPHFGSGHILKIEPGHTKPKLYFNIPDDFWHEISSLSGDFWEDSFDIEVFSDSKNIWSNITDSNKNNIIISPHPEEALNHSCKNIDDRLLSELHWIRSNKTSYEIYCIEKANEKASLGHKAAKDSFFSGKSELETFNSYLKASGQRETELPYGSIVAFDKNTAILHYQFPKKQPNGKTFLIDAGARFNGYCSDITRTYASDDVDERFKSLLTGLEKAQQEQCLMVTPGTNYIDIHRKAYENVAELLIETKVFNCSFEQAIENKLPFPFFPHGIGHPLGLQVHDVGAKQLDGAGEPIDQPVDFPYLRTLRPIQNNDVLTIEPGLYFIPLLLKPLKEDPVKSKLIDWKAIDSLIPFGGIRIEDNVVATSKGPKNLTRPFLP